MKIKVFLLIVVLFLLNVEAKGEIVENDSVIKCNNSYYSYYSNYWYKVKKTGDNWVIDGSKMTSQPCHNINKKERVYFSNCVDGDTASFIINGMAKKVRFLAIDTPEIKSENAFSRKYALKAKDYTCEKIKNAKQIILEYDIHSAKEDKYNRVLAFVFTDGELLQKSLIKEGLAKVEYIYGDYKYLNDLKEEEKIAKEKKIGIWSDMKLSDVIEDKYNEVNKFLKSIDKLYQYLKKMFTLLNN